MGYGKLIAFEGPDVAGKSSIIEKLKIVLPAIYNDKKFIYTREPGDLITEDNESEEIRKNLLSNKMSPQEQSKMFAKSRYLHTLNILEKLKEGYNVITDRYLLSSIFYQGNILGYDEVLNHNKDTIDLLNKENIGLNTIVFQITEDTYNQRMSIREEEKDALEDIEKKLILDRIDAFNSVENKSELKHIKNNIVYTVNANGTAFNRILLDTLYHLDVILKEEN